MSVQIHSMWSRARLLLVAPMVAALPACLWGQATGEQDTKRAACDKARRTLESRGRSEEVRHSIVEIQVCPDLAATSLAAVWDAPPADTAALRLLGEVSGTISDRGMLEKVSAVAGNGGRPLNERLAAIQALASYAVPGTVLLFRGLDRPGLPGGAYVMVGRSSERVPSNGPRPLVAADRAQAMQTLQRIGQTDNDRIVKAIAEYLGRRLTMSS
jgi:hypothetical protein